MNLDKWQNISGMVRDDYEVLHDEKKELEDIPKATVEIIEFKSPMGRVRLEFYTKPVVLDKKTNFSQRVGSDVIVEYEYSDSEFTNYLKAFKFNDASGEWEEMNPGFL